MVSVSAEGEKIRDIGLDLSCPCGRHCMFGGGMTTTVRPGRRGMDERWGMYHTRRAATCAAILDELADKRLLLLHAPFAAGKSSLLEVRLVANSTVCSAKHSMRMI